MKKKLSKKLNIVILILITLLVLFFSLKDNFEETITQIFTMNIWYLLVTLFLVFLFWLFRSYPIYSFCKKVKPDFKYLSALQLTLRTQFFNAVTPFATGGQPYQIYYLKTVGIDYVQSTSVVLQNFIVYQIALVLLGIFALMSNQIFDIFSKNQLLQNLITIGFITNALVIIVMFLVAFSKKINKLIVGLGIKVLTKLKLVKDKENKCANILLKDKKMFIFNIVCNFIALCSLYLVPLFVLYAMGVFNAFSAGVSIITCAYIMIIGSFVPIPGATGGLEFGFVQFFSNFITGSKLSAMMLVWRFITYYFGMIVGAIALNIKKVK